MPDTVSYGSVFFDAQDDVTVIETQYGYFNPYDLCLLTFMIVVGLEHRIVYPTIMPGAMRNRPCWVRRLPACRSWRKVRQPRKHAGSARTQGEVPPLGRLESWRRGGHAGYAGFQPAGHGERRVSRESTLEACVPRGKSRHLEDSSPGEGATMLGTQASSLPSWRKVRLAENTAKGHGRRPASVHAPRFIPWL